ncbi:MAG: FHA domain-containing protein [Kofleriaceae bacterium]
MDDATALAPTDAVVQLREVGHERVLPLDRNRHVWHLGSGRGDGAPKAMDLIVPGLYVSRYHAKITRIGSWLQVENRSRNGTFIAGRREESFPILPGDTFTVAQVSLMALDGPMVELRRVLAWHLGYEAHLRVDRALLEIVNRAQAPLLVTGPRGSEPERLATAIHPHTSRRDQPIEVIDVLTTRDAMAFQLRRAGNGLVFVDLAPLRGRSAPPPLTRALAEGCTARVMLAAPSAAVARRALDLPMVPLVEIEVPAVATRGADVPAMLDAELERRGSAHRVAELPRERRCALSAFAWPANLEEIVATAERLDAYLDSGRSIRAAARRLGVDHRSFARALERVGATGRAEATPDDETP